jgi:hypothetical protein
MAITPTQQDIKEILVYEDGTLYWLPRGHGRFDKQFAGKKAGHLVKNGREFVRINKFGLFLASRLIWIYHNGNIPFDKEVDHKDNNPNNNKIENLRLASRSQNMHNTRRRKNNTSGVKGVTFHPQTGKWRARINACKKCIEVGLFETIEEAQLAISSARESIHGAFTNHGHERAA